MNNALLSAVLFLCWPASIDISTFSNDQLLMSSDAGQVHNRTTAAWAKLETVRTGTPILVIERDHSLKTHCRMASVDDDILVCAADQPTAGSPRRFVFPQMSVSEVFEEQEQLGHKSTPAYIGLAVGVAIGAGVCAKGGRLAILCAALGGALGLEVGVKHENMTPVTTHIHYKRLYKTSA